MLSVPSQDQCKPKVRSPSCANLERKIAANITNHDRPRCISTRAPRLLTALAVPKPLFARLRPTCRYSPHLIKPMKSRAFGHYGTCLSHLVW